MRQSCEPDELIGSWTLVGDDWRLVGNKTGATRLGFAVVLKFFELDARFPGYPEEIPQQAVDYVATQVQVDPGTTVTPKGRVLRVSAAVFAVVRDACGAVLLVRRVDSGHWEPPGGHIDPGESPSEAVAREALEEGGVTVRVTAVAGVYSDPELVMVYPDQGEACQQFAVYFHAAAGGGEPRPDGVESSAARWLSPASLPSLPIHPVVRRRLHQILQDPAITHID